MICNISHKDRTTRVVIGSIFLIVGFIEPTSNIIRILSAILIIEGLIGWCGIAAMMDKFKLK